MFRRDFMFMRCCVWLCLFLQLASRHAGAACLGCETSADGVPTPFYYDPPFPQEYIDWVRASFGGRGETIKAEFVDQATTDPNLYFSDDPSAACYLSIYSKTRRSPKSIYDELAGYRNRMGYFTFKKEDVPASVPDDSFIPKKIKDSMRIIFNDASSSPACLSKGATVRVGPFAGNQAVGFFHLPNDVCTSTLPTADNGQPGHPENAYWSIDQFNLPKVATKWKAYPKTGRMVAVVKVRKALEAVLIMQKNRFHLGFEDLPTLDQDYNDLVFFLESNCRINEVYIPCLGTECPAGTVLNTDRCTCACANSSPCPGILKWDDEECRCVCPTGAENPCQSTRCATSVCDETSASCKTTPIQCPGQDASCGRWKCDPSQGCIREELSCPALANKCKQNVCNRQTWECVSKDKERPAWAVDDFCSTWACQAATGQWVETETECPEDTACETYSCDAQRGKCIKSPVPCAHCPPISCAIYACDPKRGWEVVGEQNCPAHGEDLCKEYHCEAATKACVLHDKLIPSEAADDQCNEYECNAETGEWEPHPAHDCDSKEARGCAEWSCDPQEGCLLSVRAGCCSDFDKNCTGCIGTLGCFYDPSGDLCEAMGLSLEESRAMPNGTNNWGEHACPSGRSDGGGDNTTAIVAGVVSAVASVGAVAGAAAGLAAWRKVKKRRLVAAANALEPISITGASVNPVFEAATTELENPIFHKQ